MLSLSIIIRNSQFISLLIDKSNDISLTKNLMLYFQYLYELVSPQTKFLKSIPSVGCDAESIAQVILKFFKDEGTDISKMVMLTGDSALVMLGKNNGVHVELSNGTLPPLA